MNTDVSIPEDPTLQAIRQKHYALYITGNIFDMCVEEGKHGIYYRPGYIAEKLFQQGNFVLRYSRSSGFTIHNYSNIKSNKKTLDKKLDKVGLSKYLNNEDIEPQEVVEVFRGFKSLATKGHDVPFVFIIDYASHLTSHRTEDREMQIVAETINEIANLPSVQKSGNKILVFEDGHNDEMSSLFKHLYPINYGYPSFPEYVQFFKVLKQRTGEFANIEPPVSVAAKYAKGLKFSQITSLARAYREKGDSIDKKALIEEKERAIENISDGTLNILSTDTSFKDFAGLDVTINKLSEFADKLSKQDPSSPRGILLVGPPGTGKSTITKAFANACSYNLVELSDQIKSKWVGESESRLALALDIIESLAPVILFIDEIDQAFANRSNTSLDGGVSSHYLKTLFKFAARDDLRGKICLVGCSNTPQRLDPAMINRFITLPLLEATPDGLAAIFPKIEKRITGDTTLDPENKDLFEGCNLLYKKGASPRQIFDVINHTIHNYGNKFNEAQILESCCSFRSSGDPISGAYSSLSAIQLTAFNDYLPWAGDKEYPLPWYLEDVVNTNGSINEDELEKKISEFSRKSKF